MTNRIKVVANRPDAIGMRHPLDGALLTEGSLWAYDIFTIRRLHDGAIRHAEQGAAEPELKIKPEPEPEPAIEIETATQPQAAPQSKPAKGGKPAAAASAAAS